MRRLDVNIKAGYSKITTANEQSILQMLTPYKFTIVKSTLHLLNGENQCPCVAAHG